MMKQDDYNYIAAKRLPPPMPGVEILVPLDLLPAYLKLHKIEPAGYNEEKEILIIKKTN
jgi:hypothetical protein